MLRRYTLCLAASPLEDQRSSGDALERGERGFGLSPSRGGMSEELEHAVAGREPSRTPSRHTGVVLGDGDEPNRKRQLAGDAAERLDRVSLLHVCAVLPNRELSREGVHAPARVEDRVVVRVVGRPCAHELQNESRLSREAAARKHDRAAVPADDACVDEDPSCGPLGYMKLNVRRERLECLVEPATAGEQLGVAVEHVETPNTALAVAADDERVETVDRPHRLCLPSRRQPVEKRWQRVWITRADAYASAVTGDRDAHRPPEAVDRLESGRTPTKPR